MAEKLGVDAPERDDSDPTSDDDAVASSNGAISDDDVLTEGTGPATATEAVVTDDDPSAEPDDAVEPEFVLGSSPARPVTTEPEPAVEAVDERSAAAERHPSMAQRLGLRPKGRLRARKVQRIVRRVDPWSVLKLSLIFYFCVWVMVIIAAVLLWGVAVGSGTIGSLESFIAEFLAFEEFTFNGDQLFQVFALGGLIGVFVATAVTAILSVLFNLIADLTGGIRFTVVEEESARRLLDRR